VSDRPDPPKLGRAIVQIEARGNRAQEFEFLVSTQPELDRPTVIALFENVLAQLRAEEGKP
jgi:hypothetical protein